jgi:hypothetical protein
VAVLDERQLFIIRDVLDTVMRCDGDLTLSEIREDIACDDLSELWRLLGHLDVQTDALKVIENEQD